MERVTQVLITGACVVGIVVGALWVNKNISYGCIDFGVFKHCGATVIR